MGFEFALSYFGPFLISVESSLCFLCNDTLVIGSCYSVLVYCQWHIYFKRGICKQVVAISLVLNDESSFILILFTYQPT